MPVSERIKILIEATVIGNHGAEAALPADEINFALIESLKKEVDRYVRSDMTQALRLADLTERLANKVADPNAQALGLRAKAQALHHSGKYDAAIDLYRTAKKIYETDNQPIEAARVARAMIDALMLSSRYDEALTLADEARAALTAAQENILLAQLETNVGNLYYRLDQYQLALNSYDRAHKVFAAENNEMALAIVAFNRANCYSSLDDFVQAQGLYEQAAKLYQAQNMTLAAAHVQYNLGYLHFLKGEYHQAMRLLNDVQAEFIALGDDHNCALCQLDLSEIYLQLHVLDEAIRMAAQARAHFLARGRRYEAAKALMWQGIAYLQQDKLTQAETALLTAQEEFAQEENQVYLALIDLQRAELLLLQQQPKAALALAQEARELLSKLQLKAKTCSAQLVEARALLQLDKHENAQSLCAEVLGASQILGAPWLNQQAHELWGDSLLAQENVAQAYEHYVLAIDEIELIRGGIRVDEFRSAFFQDKLRVYEKLIRLCLAEGSAEKQAEAFYYLESRKARTLVDLLLNELDVVPHENNETNRALYERWQQLRTELHWFYSKINQHEPNGKIRRLAADGHLREEIHVREKALMEMARQAQLQDDNFSWLHNVAGVTVPEFRALLSADEAAIEYYFDDETLKIFVIDREKLHVTQSVFTRTNIKDLVFELKFQLEKFQYGADYVAAHQDRLQANTEACLYELHQALFAPIADFVAGKKLFFVPFDLLHNVPFQALFDGSQYLLEKHEIACVPSARLLAWCARKPIRIPGRALIVGAADENAPQITQEIAAISELFPAAKCLDGAAATVQALTENLPDSDVVHIASHAVFRQDNPMFSAFKLAGAWLNFYDVCALPINAALVTLSGCSTGTNRIYAGDEILGLVRGFLSAGASALVVSLWAVNDPATAKLMSTFYQRLQAGTNPRQALREAALTAKAENNHPYYWAPFIFIGHINNLASSANCSPGKLS